MTTNTEHQTPEPDPRSVLAALLDEQSSAQRDHDVMIEHTTRLLGIQEELNCTMWEAEQILREQAP